jgi:CheY-like chemotaxis protein
MLRRIVMENVELRWIAGAEIWSVHQDPSQITQILANLVVNARDAIPGTGVVTIETANATFDDDYCGVHAGHVSGDYVMLSVSDNGLGMDPEAQKHLFEPFFTTKEAGKGTGLGLATVYGIVKQNSGFVNVYTEAGRGTTFKVYLPRSLDSLQSPRVVQIEKVAPRGCETVLLVEDEEPLLALGKRILERQGYKVLAARSPLDALRLVERYVGSIELLITDVVMPEMNGKQLKEALDKVRPGIKCLFMSGYTADIIAHSGVLEADVHFIQKPFSIRDISLRVRKALGD